MDFIVLVLIWGLLVSKTCVAYALNIALHAQLRPADDKVVGSVITTNGLKLAFQGRPDVKIVDIFYPAHYTSYLNHTWDVVLIEGWFPSIDQFLSLTRNNFPTAKIVFISLDPIYPGKEIVRNFDIDALLTNSEALVQYYDNLFPTEHMLLAADTYVMRPFPNISRDFGAVYIGAGGNMLEYKPELYHLLVSAIPYGLRLHGNAWEGVPVLNEVSLGGLPQFELARAYASALVVLGSTIDAQSQYQMINNRIFEALSCGALVVTKFAEELAALKCEALLLTNETHTLHTYMQQLKQWTPEEVLKIRQTGRDFILNKHTWSHRAVQIIDFYHRIVEQPRITYASSTHEPSNDVCGKLQCMRTNCPRLLWLVSPHLTQHQDYLQVARAMGKLHLCAVLSITVLPSTVVVGANVEALTEYDYILSFVTPFDALDVAMRALPAMAKPSPHALPPIIQKRACYLIGYDSALIEEYLIANADQPWQPDRYAFRHYDSVWFRSTLEIELLGSLIGTDIAAPGRIQQMFGLGVAINFDGDASATVSSAGSLSAVGLNPTALVIVCEYPYVQHCSRTNREHFLRIYSTENTKAMPMEDCLYTLLLLGGTWDEWLSISVGVDGLAFLSQRELRSVVHVREGRTGKAVQLVQQTDVVVILSPAFGDFDRLTALKVCHSRATAGNAESVAQELLLCQRNHGLYTTQEALWPLVAAAVSSARIHLLNRSPQLMSMAEEGCSGWDQEAFVTMVRTGANRLLGLGSILVNLFPTELQARQTLAGTTQILKCADACSRRDSLMLESFQTAHNEVAVNAHDESTDKLLFIKLEYEKFQVGRDGECCIQQNHSANFSTSETFEDGVQIPGDKVCLMRPYDYLVVKMRPPIEKHICERELPLNLSVQLRGSFFGDPFLAVELSIITARRFFVPAPRIWNSEWLAQNNAHVYTVSHC